MRSHLGLTRPGTHSVKSQAAAHQLSTNNTDVGSGTTTEVDPVKKQISEMHAQLVPPKPYTHKQGPIDCQEAVEFSLLKKEINELRAQVQAMGSAVTKQPSHTNPNSSELAELQKQVAELN